MIIFLASEGTHAKYHYLICGVQGDFTRSLVNDPPRQIWTRELKVSLDLSLNPPTRSLISSTPMPFFRIAPVLRFCALRPQMISLNFQLAHSRLLIIVRWRLQYFHTV